MLAIDLVRRGARQHRQRTAVQYGQETLSFGAVDELSNRLAHALIASGLCPGDRVGLLVDNSLLSIPIDFACMKARLVRVPLNARLSAAEHARMLESANVHCLIASASLVERAAGLKQAAERALTVLTLGQGPFPDLLALAGRAKADDPNLPVSPDDVVLALFTSGTTGTLKAAQHTQASYGAICANILANLVSPARDDAMIHAASLIHASGTFVLPFWIRGGRSIVLDRFDPATYLQAAAESGATHANLVPTMLAMLLEHAPAGQDAALALRSVIYGASPMPRPILERAMARWGPIFTQYYGQTEAPLAIAVLDAADHVGPDAPIGACGQVAADFEVKLVDEAGNEVAQGEVGEIAVRSASVHAGYLDAPYLDEEMRLPGGFMRTRDLGRFDERGFLHLVERTSDMIVTGGYNVYPREVEDVLAEHPAVLECAVVSGPDPQWVEAVVAFIVPRPGANASDAELGAWLRERLAGYKVPKRMERIGELPKSAVGKILRRELRKRLWEGRE